MASVSLVDREGAYTIPPTQTASPEMAIALSGFEFATSQWYGGHFSAVPLRKENNINNINLTIIIMINYKTWMSLKINTQYLTQYAPPISLADNCI